MRSWEPHQAKAFRHKAWRALVQRLLPCLTTLWLCTAISLPADTAPSPCHCKHNDMVCCSIVLIIVGTTATTKPPPVIVIVIVVITAR